MSDRNEGAQVPQRRVFSLRRIMLLLTSLVVGVVLLFAGVSLHLLDGHLEELRIAESNEHLGVAKEALAQRLRFYDDLLRAYAADDQVRDLVRFANAAGALDWSGRVRSALPQSIGAALFTSDGEVLGDPVAQRVGRACISDMQKGLAGRYDHPIPVHQEMPSLAHFDLSAPIKEVSGETIGLVFVSFSLQELTLALDRLVRPHSALALVDLGTGETLALSSNWSELADAPLRTLVVEGTDWQLQMRTQTESLMPALPAFGASIALGSGLVIVLMLIFHRILVQNYLAVAEELGAAIRGIANGERVDPAVLENSSQLFPQSVRLHEELSQLGRRHKSLHVESRTDPLTSLPNRRVFDEAMEEMLAVDGSSFCVVLLDLDGFKQTNDGFGHACGDLVLMALATAMLQVARGSDLVSRWGGDEFALLMPEMTEANMAAWIMRLREAFDVAQREYADLPPEGFCGVSCGYRVVMPHGQRDPSAVLHDADRSLYADKRARKASR